MKRVVVLVNKDFEYAGFIEGLRRTIPVYAGTNGRQAECRFKNMLVDIYCIQNLFKEGENSSNSEVKYGYLKNLFKSHAFGINDIDAILSVSTSESTPIVQGNGCVESRNGCVYVGHKFFLSDQSANDKTTQSHLYIANKSICDQNNTEFYDAGRISSTLYENILLSDMAFKNAPINSSPSPRCVAIDDAVSVGVVNVMDYACYKEADQAAYMQYMTMTANKVDDYPVGIETTHGVVVKALHDAIDELPVKPGEIPKKLDIPVNFISPIVDRYLKFDEDVDDKYGKQNFVCSYNGGVATGHILTILSSSYAKLY